MIVASGLSNVDYDYIPRRDVAEEDLVHDGRFIAVLANAPVTEDPVEMLFDAIEADDSAADELAGSAWWFVEKPVKYEDDGDVIWK